MKDLKELDLDGLKSKKLEPNIGFIFEEPDNKALTKTTAGESQRTLRSKNRA